MRVRRMVKTRFCKSCPRRCIDACPHQAIRPNDGPEPPLVLFERPKCLACTTRDCVSVCYTGALQRSGRWYSVDDLMKVVSRDSNYWGPKGGITISGGEPLAQIAFVKEFLPGERHPDARWLSFDDRRAEGGERTWIVGVVKDIRHAGIQDAPKPEVYLLAGQTQNSGLPTFLLRSTVPPSQMIQIVYRELARMGPSAAVWNPETLGNHVDDSIFRERLLAALGGFFGALALLLAAVGLYGVVAYGAARRAAEIGVRMALGARRGQVLWMVLRDALVLVFVGLALGLPASFAAGRAVASLLFDVRPEDPLTFGGTAALLAAIGLAAAWLPARRAAGMDAMRALRHE